MTALNQIGHWPWIAKHAVASLQVHDTDHGTDWGTRLSACNQNEAHSTMAIRPMQDGVRYVDK